MQYSSHFDPYWTHKLILGEGVIEKHKSLIRLYLHRSEETYDYSIENLFPLSSRRGNRSYFHAKPYILIPRMTLTMGLTRPKADSDDIGRVIGSDVTKLQEREIGNAQAWFYPAEKTLVLWECYEETLLKEVPETAKIYTLYEPYYDRPVYKTFLAKLGYRPFENATFVKEVT